MLFDSSSRCECHGRSSLFHPSEAAGEKEDVPGIKVNIRELDDVLLRDVGNRIADSKKYVIDNN